jgi:steroid 5-alpha reductase family enzyme
MLGTAILLMFTVIVVPYVSFTYGTPLSDFQTELLWDSAAVAFGVAMYCFVVGQITKNNSQVDKLWSIVPIVYAWHIAIAGGWNPRMLLMAVLVTIWGARLTYNFARRGAYTWRFWEGEEDYRWEILRQKPVFQNAFVWMLFNLFFICLYQHALIYLFTLPVLTGLSEAAPEGLIWADYLLAILFVGFVVIEYISDQQQWVFQNEKYRRIAAKEPLGEYAHGFVRTGLWGIVRHPNYGAEQAIWIVFYFFSVIATGGEWINWSVAGAVLLVILFKGSSDFSEDISASKYPEYKDYQKKVPRFVPFTKW